jgi:hypothetical protein
VFAAYILTLVPLLLVFGRLADRFGRRTCAALAIAMALVGLALLTRANAVSAAVLARLAQGAAVAIGSGSLTAAISQTHRGRIPGGVVTTIASNVGLMAGALTSAIAYDFTRSVTLALVPLIGLTVVVGACIVALPRRAVVGTTGEVPYDQKTVVAALAFALPVTFVGWSGISLYLSMVPTYLASALGLRDPVVGAVVIAAVQLASIGGTLALRSLAVRRAGVAGPAAVVIGLALLVLGVRAGGAMGAAAVLASTALVGSGGGVAFAAGVSAATAVCRGQRARVFGFLYVAAYLGFGVPSWVVGVVAAATSFSTAFVIIIVTLAAVTAALPLLGRRAALDALPA